MEPFGKGSGASEHQPKEWKPKRAADIGPFPNVASEKEDNKGKREKKGKLWRQMQADQGNVGYD